MSVPTYDDSKSKNMDDVPPPGPDPRLAGWPHAPGVAAERLAEEQDRHPQTGRYQ